VQCCVHRRGRGIESVLCGFWIRIRMKLAIYDWFEGYEECGIGRNDGGLAAKEDFHIGSTSFSYSD
jgi:hypothetical protein